MSGHATQNLVSIRKKFLFSGVSSEYKDLPKFAKDTDSHLFGEKLEDSLKKAKGRHYSLQAFKPRANYTHAYASSTKQNFQVETSKNDNQSINQSINQCISRVDSNCTIYKYTYDNRYNED